MTPDEAQHGNVLSPEQNKNSGNGGCTSERKYTNSGDRGCTKEATTGDGKQRKYTPPMLESTPHSSRIPRKKQGELDPLDLKILALVQERYNQSGIINMAGANGKTVRNRLNTLVQGRYIKETRQTVGGINQKLYELTSRGVLANTYTVEPSSDVESANTSKMLKVTRHSSSWSGSILTRPKVEPIPDKYYSPKGWTGQKIGKIFHDERGRGKIHIIPGNLMVLHFDTDFIHTIPADTDENLTVKLHDLATSMIGNFAQRHGYTVSTVLPVRDTTEIPVPKEIRDLLPKDQIKIKTGGATIELNQSGKEDQRGIEISMNKDDPTGATKTELTNMFLSGISNASKMPGILNQHETRTSAIIEQANQRLEETIGRLLTGTLQAMTPVLIDAFKAHGEENLKLLITAVTAPHIMTEIARKQVEDLKEAMKKQVEEQVKDQIKAMTQTKTSEPDKGIYG